MFRSTPQGSRHTMHSLGISSMRISSAGAHDTLAGDHDVLTGDHDALAGDQLHEDQLLRHPGISSGEDALGKNSLGTRWGSAPQGSALQTSGEDAPRKNSLGQHAGLWRSGVMPGFALCSAPGTLTSSAQESGNHAICQALHRKQAVDQGL